MLVISAGTICSSKIQGKVDQCYNLINLDAPEPEDIRWHIRVYRVFSTGENEKVIDCII